MRHANPKPIPALATEARCDICRRYRAHGNHTRCSKLRQAMYAGQKERS